MRLLCNRGPAEQVVCGASWAAILVHCDLFLPPLEFLLSNESVKHKNNDVFVALSCSSVNKTCPQGLKPSIVQE